MSAILFKIAEALMFFMIAVAITLVTKYLIPWLKDKIGADNLAQVEKWVKYAVEMAEQVHWDLSGKDRKDIVIEFLEELLQAKDLAISDEQLDVLIEAAVKEMNIAQQKKTK